MNWAVTLIVITLFAIVWLFVTAVAVGEEDSASPEMKRSMYVALAVVVLAGVGAAIVSFAGRTGQ